MSISCCSSRGVCAAIALVAAALLSPAAALAQTAPSEAAKPSPIKIRVKPPTQKAPPPKVEEDDGFLSVILENDIFYDTDRHYTNGARIAWLAPKSQTPDFVLQAARWFPLFPEAGDVRASFAFGQNMFTPRDISVQNPDPNDRPYAGFSYGAIGLVAENGWQLDQIELAVGIVGPSSLADETQKLVHEITNSQDPKGWDTQLKDEPGVVLTYQRSLRGFVSRDLLGFSFDVTPHAGGALGNVYTYANGGVTFRVGQDLPLDYGPPRIQPSLPGSGYFLPADGVEWFLFAGFEGRAVARNIFLDGNTFKDSRSVDKNIFVGDAQLGGAITVDNVRLSYTHVFRTPEFEQQEENDSFGTFAMSVNF